MTQATTTRGGKVRVLLETSTPGTYAARCGFTSKSLTFTKGLEETTVPDCDDPDKIDWVGRDAVSLSLGVSGEGVLAAESVEAWLDAWESTESVGAKIEVEFPAKTITYTGRLHVETFSAEAPNGRRVTSSVSMQSDGEFVRTSASGQAPANTVLPTITGTAEVGETLTAVSGTWTGTAPLTYSYQWRANGIAIAGATAATLDLTSAHEGAAISVRVTASNGIGSAGASSAATAAVAP